MNPRQFSRSHMLAELRSGEPFDVLVIGGGITGVGVALDAAARGLRTALVERDDFASGTSSKSSKMVHGGLRYLQNGDVRLVYEALRERRRLMQNAPHLVDVLPFMIPIMTKDSVVSKKIARALGSAMWMYDFTGGWRIGKFHKRVNAKQAAEHFPTTNLDKLSSGYLYYDAGADDARLVVTLARTAAQRGAVLANRCGVVGVTTDADGQTNGVVVEADGDQFPVGACVVVNAAGVWADDVRALDEGANPDSIRPAKGVHLTIPWEKVRNDIAVIIPVRSDKRSLFLVPWGPQADGSYSHCYVGTTDTDHDGGLDEHQTTAVDIDYVLTALNDALETTITLADVTGVWSGLRPLVKANAGDEPMGKTADLSRQHQVAVSDSGVVRVSGGKLTTYRKMAEDTVEIAMQQLGRRRRASRKQSTKRLKLVGARGHRSTQPGTQVGHLARRYGSLAAEVKALIAFEPALGEPIAPGHQYVLAEVVYAARHEMATTLSDVLERRTRLHIFDREAALTAAPRVAALMATELHWDMAETEHQLDNYRQLCAAEEAAARDQLAAHITD
ncbi:glycerol-3-phosphate dehydrogenase/oxidase [uncultured Ilumatobacter sp.]|uniref:glycerol-3-phosphate dehydrogenase/oxidase n=1 Tax=uncultured Ilumatobacter sp. TaxID=879968 RepID=UPI00374F6FD1